jgi:hypothetical protein
MEKNKQKRKQLPIYSGVLKYFPDALAEVSKVSRAGNEQHHPDKPLHWDRSKSTDELDALTRHLLEAGKIDTDGIRHSAKICWRALANLQKELEQTNEQYNIREKRLIRGDYIKYNGGSTSKHLTKNKKYKLTCEPFRDRVAIINDNGTRMNIKNKYFETKKMDTA